ncbi:Endonuclease/exonuclease/phosphatase [Geopyxis carbonaria]|nr:Endonuclease/exonuclease/phosphatase [Geopyxis carbonaria]
MMNPTSHRGFAPQQNMAKFFNTGGIPQQHSQQVDHGMGHVQNSTNNIVAGGHQHTFSGGMTNANYPSPQHVNASTTSIQNNTPHWQEQQTLLNASRSSSEPHHHARQAAILNKNSSATVAVAGGVNPNSYHPTNSQHRKDGPSAEVLERQNEKGEVERQDWKALDLGGQGLRALSNALFNYTFLDKLYINHNKLTKLPAAIGKLKLLQLLDASNNQLTEVPPELGNLVNLRQLLLFDNQLTALPCEIGSLYQLEVIGIEGNPLQDEYKQMMIKDGTRVLIESLRDTMPVSLPPVERDWIIVNESKKNDPVADADKFQVLCYNILCDKYANANMYGYAAAWALDWGYRKDLIRTQLVESKADIICLQEVDMDNFNEWFMPELAVTNYKGIFQPKTRARTMSETEKKSVDGCAIFYKHDKFRKLAQHTIDFATLAISREDFKKTADIFNRVMPKDNIAIITFLENISTGSRLIVSNVHITWDPQFRDVKLIQVAMLMEEIAKVAEEWKQMPQTADPEGKMPTPPAFTENTQIPLVVCGDFNSIADSGVYELLSKGVVNSNHDDLSGRTYGDLTKDGISHPFSLKSSYGTIGELKFTNYTPGFTGVIDYIWYTSNSLTVTGLLGNVDEKYLATVPAFPNVHFPSDHILLQTELQIKPRKEKIAKPPPPDFGGGGGGSSRAR